jgi:CBS-domain-containing membrane protein
MHSGVYARHATAAAIEVCIGLEEALMSQTDEPRATVADFMVKSAVVVESWQPVAHARQLMLTHSFSFLPVYLGHWRLISETSVARYLRAPGDWKSLMSTSVMRAADTGLALLAARVVRPTDNATELLNNVDLDQEPARLWLVEEAPGRLCGVLSPFELM